MQAPAIGRETRLNAEPRSFRELYESGVAKLDAGEFEAALAHIDKALIEEPNVPEAHNASGLALLHLNRPQCALERFEKAVALKPELAEAHANIGLALFHLNRDAEAVPRLEWALHLAPRLAHARRGLGMALARLGHHGRACEHFRAALAIRPDFVPAYVDLGLSLEALDRQTLALESYDRAIAIDPCHANAHYNRGILLERLGRLDAAHAAAERAVALDPHEMRHHFGLALLHRYSDGDPHLAAMQKMAADIALSAPKVQCDWHFALAKALIDVERHQEAFAHLKAGHALQKVYSQYDEPDTLAFLGHLRATFTPLLLAGKQGQGYTKSAPIFVVGMPRSGTTLVEQILASHAEVFGAGERKDFALAIDRLLQRERVPLPFPQCASFLSQWHLTHLGADYCNMVAAAAPAGMRIVDKMPANFQFIGLINLALPNARIIHVRRDAADTCFSIYSQYFFEDLPVAHDLGALGRYFRAYEKLMAHWRSVLPKNVMLEVQYEDIVGDLEGQARRMLSHCGLVWSEACLTFHQTERIVKTASAVQVRRPIYGSSIGRWRHYAEELRPLLDALEDGRGESNERRGESQRDVSNERGPSLPGEGHDRRGRSSLERSPSARRARPKPWPRRFRRVGLSLGIVAVGLIAIVIGDDLLASGQYSNWLVNDAVSGVLDFMRR